MKMHLSGGGYAGNLTGDKYDVRLFLTVSLIGVATLSTETVKGPVHVPALVVVDGETGRVLSVPVAGPGAWDAVVCSERAEAEYDN